MELLLSRRSGSAKTMTAPGPDRLELQQILTAACRVPDHGKLCPWRFIILEGEARSRLGEVLVECLKRKAPLQVERASVERLRFLRAPVIVVVVSRVREMIAIAVWEQILSAGAVCQTMLLAVHALGYVANWITEWPAYHPIVKERLGLRSDERIAGFVYMGTPSSPLEERARPNLETLISTF